MLHILHIVKCTHVNKMQPCAEFEKYGFETTVIIIDEWIHTDTIDNNKDNVGMGMAIFNSKNEDHDDEDDINSGSNTVFIIRK